MNSRSPSKPRSPPPTVRSTRPNSRAPSSGGRRIEPRIAQVLTTLTRYGRVIALDGKFAARRAA